MSHSEERKQSVSEWKVFRQNIVRPIMDCLGQDLEVTEEDVETAIGQLNVNCASFRFPSEECEGRGLYPTLSLISHSCVSNARYQGKDGPREETRFTCHSCFQRVSF